MSMLQKNGSAKSSPSDQAVSGSPSGERCLTLLAEGAAGSMPEVDAAPYKAFRETVSSMARQIPDRQSDADNLPVIKNVLREFETYRKDIDASLRDRQTGWRALSASLFHELLGSMGINPDSPASAELMKKIGTLATGEQIQEYRALLHEFLRPGGAAATGHGGSQLKGRDHSTANDNAAGLRGGGVAQEHMTRIMDRGGVGFVVLFRLGCLDVIGERFGLEAVQDSVMAVSAFLTHSLRGNDTVYHWSDSSLLVILESPATESIISAAMQRIASGNRDITIKIGERSVMLRIPLQFDIAPIARFSCAEDLLKFSPAPVSKW